MAFPSGIGKENNTCYLKKSVCKTQSEIWG